MNSTRQRIREYLDTIDVFDVHTHLGAQGSRMAYTLADIVSYHWLKLELVRAGAPLKHYRPDNQPDPDEIMHTVAPFFASIRNTSNHYCFANMLRELYGFDQPFITPDNWKDLDKEVRKQSRDENRIANVLDRANIRHCSVRPSDGLPDSSSRYVPYEMGEYLFAASTPGTWKRIVGEDHSLPSSPGELADAIRGEVGRLVAESGLRVLHVWIRDTWSYQPYTDSEIRSAHDTIHAASKLSNTEEDKFISFTADVLAEEAGKHGITLQLFHGMEKYTDKIPLSVSSFWNPDFIRRLPEFAARHPQTSLDLFLATRIPGHEAVSIARTSPNLSISGGWWHGFTPAALNEFFRDRLEMLPHTAWNAFFSDGYLVEWMYAKLFLTKNRLAHALGDMIEEGFFNLDDAFEISRNVMHDNALRIYNL